jgi:hypothetical protein
MSGSTGGCGGAEGRPLDMDLRDGWMAIAPGARRSRAGGRGRAVPGPGRMPRAALATVAAALVAACGAGETRSPPAQRRAEAPAPPPEPASTDPMCRDAPSVPVAAPGPGSHLLLVVSPDTSPTHAALLGVGIVGADGELRRPRRTPWREGAPNPFAPFGLQPRRAFDLLLWGRTVGTATVDSTSSYTAAVTLSAARAHDATLATDLPVDSGGALLYQATPAERRAMRDLLRDTIVAHQYVWYAEDERREMRVSAVLLRGDTVALVGSYLEREVTAATDFPFMSVMIVAERDSGGVYRASWSGLWGDPGNDRPYTPQLLDVVDLDHDGIPEIVTISDESMGSGMFSVFKRGPRGWREVLRSGC